MTLGFQSVTSGSDIVIADGLQSLQDRPLLLWPAQVGAVIVSIKRRPTGAFSGVFTGDSVVVIPEGSCLVLNGLDTIRFHSSYDVCVGTPEEFAHVLNHDFFLRPSSN